MVVPPRAKSAIIHFYPFFENVTEENRHLPGLLANHAGTSRRAHCLRCHLCVHRRFALRTAHLQKMTILAILDLFRTFLTQARTMSFQCRFTRVLKEHKPFRKRTIFPGISAKTAQNPVKSSWTYARSIRCTLFLQSFTLGKGKPPFSAFFTEKSLFFPPSRYNKPGNFS